MAEDTKLQAELVLKDATDQARASILGGLNQIRSEADRVSGTLAGMAKGAFTTALGFQLSGGIDGIKKFAGEIMDAAKEVGGQEKAIAAVISVSDKVGLTWDELRGKAKGIRTDLEDIATKWGASTAATTEAFESISARSGKSTDAVLDLVDKMTLAGRGVKGGLGGISEGFAMMEAGAFRARNPIVQMIAQTGVLTGNAKQVAAQLTKMKPEDAIALGEKAIERMADKMKFVKPTFGEMLQSVKNIREELLAQMGTPLLGSLREPMKNILNYMKGHRVEMEAFARSAGDKIGKAASWGFEKFSEGAKYIESHSAEIRDALMEGWGYAKAVIDLIIRNRDLLKMGLEVYALSKGAGFVGHAVTGGLGLMGGPGTGKALIQSSLAAGAPGLGIAGGGVAAGVATFGALAAAVVAAGWAAGQWLKVAKEHGELRGNQDTLKDSLEQLAKAGATEAVDKQVASMRELDEASKGRRPWFDWVGHLYAAATNADNTMGMADKEFNSYAARLHETAENARLTYGQVVDQLSDLQGGLGAPEDFEKNAAQIVDSYNFAQEQGSAAAIRYASDFMLRSGLTAQAIADAGLELAGGFEKFQEQFVGATESTATMLRSFMHGGSSGEVKAPQVNIGGGNTFNIKQDFRDSDPDRIVAIFRRDIVKAASARAQSRLGTPFGGI